MATACSFPVLVLGARAPEANRQSACSMEEDGESKTGSVLGVVRASEEAAAQLELNEKDPCV